MSHDHAAYMRRWRRTKAERDRLRIKVETLTEEIRWFTNAHENSADQGYTTQYRDGFKAAIGWLELHRDIAQQALDVSRGTTP